MPSNSIESSGPARDQGAATTLWDARLYDRVATPHVHWGEAVISRLPLAGRETVLDAGCGTGRVTQLLLDAFPELQMVAVDASAEMLHEARRRLAAYDGRVRFQRTDLCALQVAELPGCRPVDAVISTATFHWILDHERLFRMLAAVMRDGAPLSAQCGGEGNIASVIAAARKFGVNTLGRWNFPSPETTARYLKAAGFTDIEVWSHPEPTLIRDRQERADFLQTVALREYVATLKANERRPFVEAIIDAMPDATIDYVRLNIVARKGHRT
ncbi:MAG TPA: methyltransferase domain-containing protein [Thermomicrobiaceae bacterium]|nr:methyltransferase domain-containing protein [Thermomicrobiaceae bacterium]